ncbi:fatty acyl-AMP ligase [Streptomyces sp. GC420]|uniref:fatty acyl-AMP ligase n=1 Tax=Streptomyces sp. GC420 TaxID=2697568 RepID=UPI0028BEEB7A|nr:fatty acyl-AMP ligase [Streptomyces sp. GC420]
MQTPDETAFTFVDFSTSREGACTELTWSRLDSLVRATAAGLRRAGAAGERVAVVAPQGPDYVVGFLGAVCAGAIAVPLFPPTLPGHAGKLAAALSDAQPVLAVAHEDQRESVSGFCKDHAIAPAPRVVTIEELRDSGASGPEGTGAHHPRPDACAYLQYTSGSTRNPTGVEISHTNVCVNARQALDAYDVRRGTNSIVGWLPLYHDMGLVLMIAMPVVGHIPSVIMDPLAFVQQPERWLRLLARHDGAMTAAPNFAFDYCVQRVGEENRAALSLGSVAVMVNGSEPIRPATLDRFHEAFAPSGIRRTAMRPSYGLAEATVFVCASPAGEEPTAVSFDRDLLARGAARAVEPGEAAATTLVACGRPTHQEVAIVDPATLRGLEDGRIGEIWLRGPNIGGGYWGRPEESRAAFRAVMAGDDPDDPAHHWLRTGDLGMWHDKQLYVTGRIKDLVIIDGVNHYPQDIEETVQQAHPALRPRHIAAFAVPTDEGERLVVVAEHSRDLTDPRAQADGVARAVRAAVAGAHAVAVHDFVLAAPDTVPFTTSGKVARSGCRERYLEGAWTGTDRRQAAQKGTGGA